MKKLIAIFGIISIVALSIALYTAEPNDKIEILFNTVRTIQVNNRTKGIVTTEGKSNGVIYVTINETDDNTFSKTQILGKDWSGPFETFHKNYPILNEAVISCYYHDNLQFIVRFYRYTVGIRHKDDLRGNSIPIAEWLPFKLN